MVRWTFDGRSRQSRGLSAATGASSRAHTGRTEAAFLKLVEPGEGTRGEITLQWLPVDRSGYFVASLRRAGHGETDLDWAAGRKRGNYLVAGFTAAAQGSLILFNN